MYVCVFVYVLMPLSPVRYAVLCVTILCDAIHHHNTHYNDSENGSYIARLPCCARFEIWDRGVRGLCAWFEAPGGAGRMLTLLFERERERVDGDRKRDRFPPPCDGQRDGLLGSHCVCVCVCVIYFICVLHTYMNFFDHGCIWL